MPHHLPEGGTLNSIEQTLSLFSWVGAFPMLFTSQQATVVSSQPLMDIAPPRSMEDLSTVEDVRSLRC